MADTYITLSATDTAQSYDLGMEWIMFVVRNRGPYPVRVRIGDSSATVDSSTGMYILPGETRIINMPGQYIHYIAVGPGSPTATIEVEAFI